MILTTTGNTLEINILEWGAVLIQHPSSINITQFSVDKIRSSDSLKTYLDNGDLYLTDSNGNTISNSSELNYLDDNYILDSLQDASDLKGEISFGQDTIAAPEITEPIIHDYNPIGLNKASVLLLSANINCEITGIAAPSTGKSKLLILFNTSRKKITLIDNSPYSISSNRIMGSDKDIVLKKSGLILVYDTLYNKYRPI